MRLVKESLTIVYADGDNAGNVTTNLGLITSADNDVIIAWASNNETVIATDGTVTRPTGADADVMLTATISKGMRNVFAIFSLKVVQN